jgi:hypothetical protein
MSGTDPHGLEIVANHPPGNVLRQVTCIAPDVKNVLRRNREVAPDSVVVTWTRKNFNDPLVMKIVAML